MQNKILKTLTKIKDNTTDDETIKLFNKKIRNLKFYKDEEGKNILHLLITESTGTSKLLKCYKVLVKEYPNLINDLDYDRKTFMYYLVDKYYYDANFIYEILKIIPNYNTNIINDYGNTFFYTYLENLNTIQEIDIKIYDLISDYGYNSLLKNEDDETILDIIENNIRVKNNYYEEFINKFHEKTNNIYLKKNKIKQTENYDRILDKLDEINNVGYLLNEKEYITAPSIGREEEVTKLMITLANKRKNPILVGESGVGKTTLVDELVYRIQNDKVKDFLKGQNIIEVNATTLVAGTELRGSFERKVKDLLELCVEENIILFIDEIHEIYGAGLSKGDKTNDMAAMLKYYIDRKNIKIIGSTTKFEYDKYFSNDALKRRFEMIEIKEPTKQDLKIIVKKVIDDMALEYNIGNDIIDDTIINILVELTSLRKKYDDPINNPDLVISIIDKIYSFAYYNSRTDLIIEDIIDAINACDRIYPSIKERYIKDIKCNKKVINKPIKKKVLNFSDYVKNNA